MTIKLTASDNVELNWNVLAIYMPLNGLTEYVLADKDSRTAKAWAEINYVWTRKDEQISYGIDTSRIKNSQQAASLNKLPFILIVQWNDFLGWIEIKPDVKFPVSVENGRDKMFIPVTAFKEVKQRDSAYSTQ